MKDIFSVEDSMDLVVAESSIPRAANVLSVQLGDLEYAADFGVDKKYFLASPFLFQTESFKAYLVQRLADYQINVASVMDTFLTLMRKLTFFIPEEIDPAIRFTNEEIIDNVLTDADGAYLTDADGGYLTDAF